MRTQQRLLLGVVLFVAVGLTGCQSSAPRTDAVAETLTVENDTTRITLNSPVSGNWVHSIRFSGKFTLEIAAASGNQFTGQINFRIDDPVGCAQFLPATGTYHANGTLEIKNDCADLQLTYNDGKWQAKNWIGEITVSEEWISAALPVTK